MTEESKKLIFIENPDSDQKRIEKLKDEFWEWWYEQIAKAVYQPSIFDWFIKKMDERESSLIAEIEKRIEENCFPIINETDREKVKTYKEVLSLIETITPKK